MILEIKTKPSGLPVTVAEVKEYMRREAAFTDDDIMIRDALVNAETTRTEVDTARKLVRQTWIAYSGGWWSGKLEMPFGELAVVEIRYTDYDGVQNVLSAGVYDVWKGNRTTKGYIRLAQDQEWPSDTLATNNPIEIEFECGFHAGDDWTDATVYTLGTYVQPTVPNGWIYECTTAGTSGGSEPDWPLTLGDTVNDNTAVWTCVGEELPYALKRAVMIGVCDSYDQPGDILLYPNENLLKARRLMIETWRLF